jgi:hypothetical protein
MPRGPASGCSEDRSADATRPNRSAPSNPSVGTTSVSAGRPWVIVPVLSNTMASSRWAVSSASAERIRIPDWAPLPVPTMIDYGVSSPSAHGQAMIRTATAATNAR